MPLDTETPHHQRSLRLGPDGTRLEQGHFDLGDGHTGPTSASDDPEIERTKPERSDNPNQSQLELGRASCLDPTRKSEWSPDRTDGPEDE